MEARTFERIQKVIRDHLLAFKAQIIQKQAIFRFRAERLNKLSARFYVVRSICYFVLFSSPPRSFFSSKSRKDSSEMMFPLKVYLWDIHRNARV